MIEKVPKTEEDQYTSFLRLKNPEIKKLVNSINSEYQYWDKVKYLAPDNISPTELWNSVKVSRNFNQKQFEFSFCKLHFSLTDTMQKIVHMIDFEFGDSILSSAKNKNSILISSVMEEAIHSSKMEGASTTRKVAKEMLRSQKKPSNQSERMISNNYNAFRFLANHKDEQLTKNLLLETHRIMTKNTLEKREFEGTFRDSDDIEVVNNINNEIVHVPPTYFYMENYIQEICNFANNDNEFIHPIIKGIILHFLLAYLHPFRDGNGRTARAVFYWYMLKNGYKIMEYASISTPIYKSKSQYEKSFLYCENDDMDIGYFITYNLKIITSAFANLKSYIEHKNQNRSELFTYREIPEINERQAFILNKLSENPSQIVTCKDFEIPLDVSIKTIRTDLEQLVRLGYLQKRQLNKRLIGYMKKE